MVRGLQYDMVDGLSSSVAIKGPCAVSTTANVTLSGEQTIDGVLTNESRVLVRNQTVPAQNGIYVTSTGDWRRAKDFSRNDDVVKGTAVYVSGGSTGSGLWVLTTANPIVFDTSSLTFSNVNVLLGGGLLSANNLSDLASAIAGWDALARYDQTQVITPALTVLDLSTATSPLLDVAAGAVSSVTLGTAKLRVVRFTGATVFTVGANLIGNNNGANITTSADDVGIFFKGVDGKVRLTWLPAIGVQRASTTELLTGTDAAKMATPDAIAALWEKGSDAASGTTVTLGEGGLFHITGTTTITDIDFSVAKNGRTATLIFDGVLTLTHNGTTLQLPGGKDIVTGAGDRAIITQDNGDNIIVLSYVRASRPPSGAIDLLATGTVASSATLDIALGNYTAYRGILVKLSRFLPATDNVSLWLRVSTNGGSSYDAGATDYVSALLTGDTSSTAFQMTLGSGGAAQIPMFANAGNRAGQGVTASVEFFDQTNTALYPDFQIYSRGQINAAVPAQAKTYAGAGQRQAAQDTDAIRFLFSSGNIASGSYKVMGYA